MSRSLSLIFTAFLLLELVSQQRTRLFASAFKLRPSHGPFNTAPDRSIQAVKTSLKTLLASLVVLLPLSVSATPLGEHTVCSYPACTSQAEILLNTAPNLVSKEETDRLYGILASIQKFLQAYPSYLENQDYYSIRGGLRSQPVSQLRLTCRKIRVFLPPDSQIAFSKAYDVMISHFDDLDLEVNNLILKRTSSAEGLTKALQAAISSYDEIVSIASVLVEPSEPPPSTDVIVSSL